MDVYLEGMAADLGAAWPDDADARLTVILVHALQFSTWQTLAAPIGDDVAAALVTRWLECLATAERSGSA